MSVNRPLPNMPTDSKTTFKVFKTQKNQTQKGPLKIQKPKISLKTKNVRKQTPPKYSHSDSKTIFRISKSQRNKLKKTPLKSKNLK